VEHILHITHELMFSLQDYLGDALDLNIYAS